jgi:hypothetical protein
MFGWAKHFSSPLSNGSLHMHRYVYCQSNDRVLQCIGITINYIGIT